jgi:hypothetical protein
VQIKMLPSSKSCLSTDGLLRDARKLQHQSMEAGGQQGKRYYVSSDEAAAVVKELLVDRRLVAGRQERCKNKACRQAGSRANCCSTFTNARNAAVRQNRQIAAHHGFGVHTVWSMPAVKMHKKLPCA